MIDARTLDELARRVTDLIPSGVGAAGADIADNVRDALRAGLRKLDLVTRDEFDVQRAVLLRTRELVEALEARVADLETQLQPPRH
ncbi:MAG TPA: accessory factor UbiK family protein [Tahibacter sp.]|uniref:ubiquinone biosynthesis accessory factor UbiK n=1 Tax=Tahibacter sp. TaxID=2056211 RepID=UPI002CB16F97|nr:accessory factor UbiK family protein [Tahibacter sp.]HSX61504.1 accessory factor UbiK family protein [Tahibacter sp.]